MQRVLSGELNLVTDKERFLKDYIIDRNKLDSQTFAPAPDDSFIAELRGRQNDGRVRKVVTAPVERKGRFLFVFDDNFAEYVVVITSKASSGPIYRSSPFDLSKVAGYYHKFYVVERKSLPGEGISLRDLGELAAEIKSGDRDMASLNILLEKDALFFYGKHDAGPGKTSFRFRVELRPYGGEDLGRLVTWKRRGRVHTHNPNIFAKILGAVVDLFGKGPNEIATELIDKEISDLRGKLLGEVLEEVANELGVPEAKVKEAFQEYATMSTPDVRFPTTGTKPKVYRQFLFGTKKFYHREIAIDLALGFPRDLARDLP